MMAQILAGSFGSCSLTPVGRHYCLGHLRDFPPGYTMGRTPLLGRASTSDQYDSYVDSYVASVPS